MKLLIGCHDLTEYGGSQSHTHALAEEMLRRGYEVELISVVDGQSPYADNLGIILNDLHGDYDAALLSHHTTVTEYKRLFPDNFREAPVIQTIHGLTPLLERPCGIPGVRYVSISEEIRERYPDSTVILNGVNLDRFEPIRELPEKPARLLSMSQSTEFNMVLEKICKERNILFIARNKFANPVFDVEEDMQNADICVAIGRSAYEAMACGCATLIADHRPYQKAMSDGWISCDWTYERMLDRNCTGRWFQHSTQAPMIGVMLDEYDAEKGDEALQLALRHHNIRVKAEEYLRLIEEEK